MNIRMLLEAADFSTIENLKKAISRGQVPGIRPSDKFSDKVLLKIIDSLKDVDKKYKNSSIILALQKIFIDLGYTKRKINPEAYELFFTHSNNNEIEDLLNDFKKNNITDTQFVRGVKIRTKKLDETDFTKLYEDDEWVLVHPKTFAASCKYGKNTRWCTTMDTTTFREYSGLLVIINKKTNEKYQTDVKSELFNDEKDRRLWWQELYKLYARLPMGIKEILYKKGIRNDESIPFQKLREKKSSDDEYVNIKEQKNFLKEMEALYAFNEYLDKPLLEQALLKKYNIIMEYILKNNKKNIKDDAYLTALAFESNNIDGLKLLLDYGFSTLPIVKYKIPKTLSETETILKKRMKDLIKKHQVKALTP